MSDNILVIQPLPGIGDALWFLPHLVALRRHYPNDALTLLTKPSSKADDVLGETISLDHIIWLQRDSGKHKGLRGFFSLVGELKKQNFSVAWLLHKSPRYALAAKLAGIKTIYGYGQSFSRFLVKSPVLTIEEQRRHPIEQATLLLKHHGITVDPMTCLKILPKFQKNLRQEYGLKAKDKILVLGIGGSEVYKKWPAASFASVATQYHTKGYRIFILGGAQEKREALLIAAMVEEQGGAATAVFHLSIQESFALLSLATLFIGNDTGMLNGAALLNVPTFGLFAKTHPLAYRPNLHPLTPPLSVLEPSVGDITVDQVMGASHSIISK